MMEGGGGGVEDNNNEEICRWEATRICQNHQQIYPKIGLTTHKRLSLKNVFLSLSVRSPLSFTNHSKTADNDCKAQELKSRPRATGIYVFNFQFSSSRNAFISFLLFLAHFYDSFFFPFLSPQKALFMYKRISWEYGIFTLWTRLGSFNSTDPRKRRKTRSQFLFWSGTFL